jgi:FkbM family methyltransferase
LRLIARMLLVLKFIFVFGAQGIPIAWKLYVGKAGRLVIVTLPGGHRMMVRKRTSEVAAFRQTFLERESDVLVLPQGASVTTKYQEILARGRRPLVIVCGANTGLSAIFFVLLFPQALVVAMEPSDDNFEMLQRNVGFYPSIIPMQTGVWDKNCHLRIANPNADPLEYQTVECDPGERDALAALTMDDILMRFPDGELLLIKIDIEGSEQALFRSHTDWIERTPLMIVELHDWLLPQRRTSAAFLSLLGDLQCDFVIRGENVLIFNWAAFGVERSR